MLKTLKRMFGSRASRREVNRYFRPSLEGLGERVMPAGGVAPPTFVWTGAVSDNWWQGPNWQSGLVPQHTDDVLIPETARRPVVRPGGPFGPNNQIANNVTINEHAWLTVEGVQANINGLHLAGYMDSHVWFDTTASGPGILTVNTQLLWSAGGFGTLDDTAGANQLIVGPNATASITAPAPWLQVNFNLDVGSTTTFELPVAHSYLAFTRGGVINSKGTFDHKRGNYEVPLLQLYSHSSGVSIMDGNYNIKVNDVSTDVPIWVTGGTLNLEKYLTLKSAGASSSVMEVTNWGEVNLSKGATIDSLENRQGKYDIAVTSGWLNVTDDTRCTISLAGLGQLIFAGTLNTGGYGRLTVACGGTLYCDHKVSFSGQAAFWTTINVETGKVGLLESSDSIDLGKGFLGDETECHITVVGVNLPAKGTNYTIIKVTNNVGVNLSGDFDSVDWVDPTNQMNHAATRINNHFVAN